jgi:hypothetical protein
MIDEKWSYLDEVDSRDEKLERGGRSYPRRETKAYESLLSNKILVQGGPRGDKGEEEGTSWFCGRRIGGSGQLE